jgi:hypothetical protein
LASSKKKASNHKILIEFWGKHPKLSLIIKFAVLFLLFWMICWQRLDNDFGWHLVSGNYIRAHWVPQHDIFTYTAKGFEWINHEWGNDVIVSFLYGNGAFVSLSLVFAALWTAAFAICGIRTRFITLLIAVCAVLPYVGVRPVTWTVIFFALLLRICQSKAKWPRLLIPVLILVWANLHGGFIAGLALIVYFAIKNRDKYLWYILPVSILVTFINPYGPRLYVEISRTLFDSSLHLQISEWHYVTIFNTSIPYVALWAAGFWIFSRNQRRNWFGLGPLLLAASMSATRNLPLFVIASYNDLDLYFTQFLKELSAKGSKNVESAKLAMLGLLAVVLVSWLSYSNRAMFSYWLDSGSGGSPEGAVAFIKSHKCNGNLFASYDYGGYLIWKLPQYPLYIDGRMPSWRDENGNKYLDRYLAVFKDDKARRAEFERYNINCVLLRNDPGIKKLIVSLKRNDWQLISSANGSVFMIAPRK